jgi:hypothetical protein
MKLLRLQYLRIGKDEKERWHCILLPVDNAKGLGALLFQLLKAFHRNKQPKRAKGLGCAVGFYKSQAFFFRWGKASFLVPPELSRK